MGVVLDRLHDPQLRFRLAVVMFFASLVLWPATHVLMILTQPTGFTSWAAHLLLGLSWLAVTYTSVDIMATTDVRREQEDDEG